MSARPASSRCCSLRAIAACADALLGLLQKASRLVITDDPDTLDAQQLCDALRAARADAAFKQAVIDKLTHENAIL